MTSLSHVHERAARLLSNAQHRYTAQRKAIVDLLASARSPHSLPELLSLEPTFAQSSLYRNLGVLEEAGVVSRIVTGDEFAKFELAEELSGHHHHHLICQSCGAIQDITASEKLERLVEEELGALAAQHGFQATTHQLDLLGRCASCI